MDKERVIQFFERKIRFPYKKVNEKFILNKEYWTEDEVEDLLLDFFSTFKVNYVGFNILCFFDEEPSKVTLLGFFSLFRLFNQYKYSPLSEGKTKLTINHMI